MLVTENDMVIMAKIGKGYHMCKFGTLLFHL